MMTTIVRAGLVSAIAAWSAAPMAEAQSSGAFVTRLGLDTVSVEQFARTPTRLEGQVLNVMPRVTLIRYHVDFGPGGEVREFGLEQRAVNDTAPPVTLQMVFGTDSIRTTRVRGDQRTQRAVPAAPNARPHALYLWALYELETEAFARAPADSMEFWLVSTGGAPAATMFRRRAPDTLSTTWFLPEYHLDYAFAPDGRLQGLNGLNTTVKVLVERTAGVPFDDLVARATERERAGGALGAMSPHDSITTTVRGTEVTVVYGRPAMRGRTVWGGVVPLDQVWRTGADAATRFRVSAPVSLGGVEVPAGTYTLFSLPTAAGATLIVNKQVGQWGTEYHPEQDLARVPVTVETLAAPTERFTIAIREAPSGDGALVLEWDRTRWVVPLRPSHGGH